MADAKSNFQHGIISIGLSFFSDFFFASLAFFYTQIKFENTSIYMSFK